jgi:hypothetical protein
VIGIIEKSCIDGQKQYQGDIATAIKKEIKEHPAEYGAPEGSDETAGEGSTDDGENHTEASAYAAENRKRRQDNDMGYIQGGFDKVFSGFGAIGSGLSAVFESVGDLLSDLPIGKEVILGTFILVLLASNVYTYMAFKGRAPERLARRQGRQDDMSEVFRMLMERSAGLADAGRIGQNHAEPRKEVEELVRMLDDVEARTARLRSAVTKAGEHIPLDELD